MDLRKVRKLIEIFNASKLSEIEIREGDESIRLTRTPTITTVPAQVSGVDPEYVHVSPADPGDIEIEDQDEADTFAVKSPMVGTFFAAASPTDPPFVSVGDSVNIGDPLCLIEAMKIFNQIEAEHSGTIVKVLKEDHDPVEYGEPIFLLRE